MELREIQHQLETTLSEKRYIHSLNVAQEAVKLAGQYGGNADKAYLAGLLHDCAKEIAYEKALQLLEKYGEEVQFTFRAVFAQNAEHLREIRFHFNHDLTDNIILRGLPAATKRVLCGCKDKSKPNKIKYN